LHLRALGADTDTSFHVTISERAGKLKQPHKKLAELAEIRPHERDYNLGLQSPRWGTALDGAWELASQPARHFKRKFYVHGRSQLLEHIVPFPSAPIMGINRKAEYGRTLQGRPNMRTIRVLQRPMREASEKPISRVFFLHNGLNERDSLRFYYRLADWILRAHYLSAEGAAACVIMPFPGHLTHYNFHGPFSETPLTRYLSDAGELFRQFLRYMVEMRWLLSIVLESDAEPWMVGGGLFGPESLATDLQKESDSLYRASRARLKRARAIRAKGVGRSQPALEPGLQTGGDQIDASIEILREILGRSASDRGALRGHVVGYSLGGFLAQSIFFAWPQAVSSCTTICSGGAIKALSPTAFAHPEEWQSVLHSLRPEMNNSMLQGRLADPRTKPDLPTIKAAGMSLEDFGYFERIFDQVFLQEDRGSYKERLAEYGGRMLFVSGGDDPIVRPTEVLDASPEKGITMLSVARMSHFLDNDPDPDDPEKDQRDFWLPEAGRLLTRAAIHAEENHTKERGLAREMRKDSPPKAETEGHEVPRPKVPLSKTLDNDKSFERALDWVLKALDDDQGWLFVCRNALPPAFVPEKYFDRWGMALHHHDVPVQEYSAGLRQRARLLQNASDQLTLIVPAQLKHWFVDLSARFDPHSDAPSGRMTDTKEREQIWTGFEDLWLPAVRRFEAGLISAPAGNDNFKVDLLAKAIVELQGVAPEFAEVTNLPDVWIGVKANKRLMSSAPLDREIKQATFINGVANLLSMEKQDRNEALEELVDQEDLRVLSISGAEFNPRYRGKVVQRPGALSDLLAWTAGSLVRSRAADEAATAS
jgi:pimeloyl-ACP methyl ester carboxylesterase